MLTPINPGIPDPIRAALTSLSAAVRDLQTPGAPTRLFATDKANLPPAASYPQRLVLVSDLNVLAHSDGTRWVREDTGAVIA